MTSTQPPTIDASPATPAHEWAHDTTSALDPTQTQTQRPPLEPKPSGPAFPGAYPSEHDAGQPDVDLNAAADQVKQATVSAITTAKEYIPSQEDASNAASRVVEAAREYIPAKEQVQNVTRTVVDTARQYLPETVAAYLPPAPNDVSMPTTETSGAQPGEKTSGAGALPGPVSEPGVAVLPEQRPVEADNPQVVTSTESQTPSHGGEAGAALLLSDENKLRGGETTGKLPSKDLKGRWPMRGVQGGIGTLSWAGSDSSIAVLPDEKNTTANGSSIPSGTSETNGAQTVSHDVLKNQQGAEYRLADQHPGPSQTGHSTAGDIQKALPTPGHSNGGSSSHKPKFMDRVKGEAKIIAGKLGGNEEKIEQGKRLKGMVDV